MGSVVTAGIPMRAQLAHSLTSRRAEAPGVEVARRVEVAVLEQEVPAGRQRRRRRRGGGGEQERGGDVGAGVAADDEDAEKK